MRIDARMTGTFWGFQIRSLCRACAAMQCNFLYQSKCLPRYQDAIRQHELYMAATDPLAEMLGWEGDFARRDLEQGMEQALEVRLLPPVALGYGHTNIAEKYSALLHTISLEAGDACNHYLSAVVGCTTDQGLVGDVGNDQGPPPSPNPSIILINMNHDQTLWF